MRFLEKYLEAAESNPVIGLKDNLINILLHEQGADLFGGCAGYGCGAAFNFVTLLADGEVHAWRWAKGTLVWGAEDQSSSVRKGI